MTNSISTFSTIYEMFLQSEKSKYEIQLIVLKALVDKEITQKQVDYFIDSLEDYKQK